jgi:galactose mutarotase-like enzyme
MITIQNADLEVVAQLLGAQLTSVLDKRNNIQHLWQADENVWPWHAPVLFPTVGRCLNDEIWIEGKPYPMQKHGFARNNEFELAYNTGEEVKFVLKSNARTLEMFPFLFEFSIAYALKGNQLITTYGVKNPGDKNLPFSVGGHPAFSIPFIQGESIEDYFLEFEQVEESPRHHINSEGFFDGRKTMTLNNTNRINITRNLFNDDALIFKYLKSTRVTIRSYKNSHSLSVDFKGFEYLGIWAKEGAQYVCIEPWIGCADTAGLITDFNNKEGVRTIEPGNEFIVHFTTEIV